MIYSTLLRKKVGHKHQCYSSAEIHTPKVCHDEMEQTQSHFAVNLRRSTRTEENVVIVLITGIPKIILLGSSRLKSRK